MSSLCSLNKTRHPVLRRISRIPGQTRNDEQGSYAKISVSDVAYLKKEGGNKPPFLDLFPIYSFKNPNWVRMLRKASRFSERRGTSGKRSFPAGSPIIVRASFTGTGLVSINKKLGTAPYYL